MNVQKNILVAPLNWGLGHATRCIPIIKAMQQHGFRVIVASDGSALTLLQKEFPELLALELPSYEIAYAKKGEHFKWKLIKNSPKTIAAILEEKKIVKRWIQEYELSGILSDNRLGVYSKKIPSVFMTHQLNVLSGKTTWLSSKLHQFFIRKFTECWIPDYEHKPNLTGKLGHIQSNSFQLQYLGIISRFQHKPLPIVYDLLIVLSGPEPQRTLLEEKLRQEIKRFTGKVLMVCGVVESEQRVTVDNENLIYNYMTSDQLEVALLQSEKILCRSGYTTVMDVIQLGKKAFFIPTPGQFEQEYLAKRLKRNGYFPYEKQEDFRIEQLSQIDLYKGFPQPKERDNWKQLLILFQGE